MHKTNLSHSNTRKGHSMKKVEERKRSQAALDYLVSWGWILIIIVAAVIVLFSLGVFRVPSAPTIISGFSGITMQAAQANSTMMVVKLTNNYNQFINLTGITVNVNGNTYKSLDCLNSIISTGQSTLCRIPVSISTSSYLSNIQISFTPYKSSIYEVSNGTVSSTLVSGSIPINNQLTYFVEKGLPYGSTFTVNYNTSTNSTVVSSINDNVSFDLPFGNYYFSVPTVNYQGCVSTPSPVSGYHSTGVGELIRFASNCTTTFSETGLPSSQKWSVSYNGSTASNSTGSSIYIKTKNVTNAQISYTAIAKSDNLVCVSYKTPLVRLGGSYTFSAWNCTTSFSESGLPTQSSYNEWYISNFGGSKSGTQTAPNKISFEQYNIKTVSAYSATANSYELSCFSNPTKDIYQGATESFSWWVCTTEIQDKGLSPYPTSWNATFAGITSNDNSVNSNSIFKQNVTTVTSQPYSTAINSYSCSSSSSTLEGSNVTDVPWKCVTRFSDSGVTNYPTSWNAQFDGVNEIALSVNVNIGVPTGTGPSVLGSFSYSTSITSYSCSSSSSTLAGSNVTDVPWKCVTTFSDSGVTNYPTSWNAQFDGVQENSQSVDSNIGVPTGTGPSVLGSFSYSTGINSYSCASSSSTLAGSTITSIPWVCDTTFDTNSVLSSDYPDGWSVSFDSVKGSGSTSDSLAIQTKSGPSILGYFSYSSSTGTYDCYSNNPPNELAGSTITSIPWQCTTTFIGSGLPTSGYSNYNWDVTFLGQSNSESENANGQLNTGLGKGSATLSVNKGLTCSASDSSITAGNNGVATTFTCNNLYLLGPDNITVISGNMISGYVTTHVISAGYGSCPGFGYAISGVSTGSMLSLIGRCKNSTGHYTVSATLNPYSNTISNNYAWGNSVGLITSVSYDSALNSLVYSNFSEVTGTANYGATSYVKYIMGGFVTPTGDSYGGIDYTYPNACTVTEDDTFDIVTYSSSCGGSAPVDLLPDAVFFFQPYNTESYDGVTYETGDGSLLQWYGSNVAMEGSYNLAISNQGWFYSSYQYRSTCFSVTCQNNGFNVMESSELSHVHTSLPNPTTSNNYVPIMVVDNQKNVFFVVDGNNGCVYQFGPLNTLSYSEEQSYCTGDKSLDGAALSPNGNFLYVASYGNNETYVFGYNNIGYGAITTIHGPYALPPINLGILSDIFGNVHFEDQKGLSNEGLSVNNIISEVFKINSQSGLV